MCNDRLLDLIYLFVLFFTAVAPMRMQMPMNSLPMLMDFTSDDDSKTTKTPLTVGLDLTRGGK